jgi:hypothetical protein
LANISSKTTKIISLTAAKPSQIGI